MPKLPENKIISLMEEMLKVTADATRLKIMFALLDEEQPEKCVNEIYTTIGASQSLVSHQLKVLKDADLVRTRKESTKVYYSLKDKHVRMLLGVAYEHVMEEDDHD